MMITMRPLLFSFHRPTKESRDKMAKSVSQMSEQVKSKIRSIRQDGMKQLKQDSKVTPADEIKKFEKMVTLFFIIVREKIKE